MASRTHISIHIEPSPDFPISDLASRRSANNDESSQSETTEAIPVTKTKLEDNRIPAPLLEIPDRKRTRLLNCAELSEHLNRTEKQITDLLVYTIGTVGNFVDEGYFVMKGRFQQRQIERALKQFVDQYILCHSCNTWNTVLETCEEKRLLLLQCRECGHSSKVPEIKAYKGCRGLTTSKTRTK